MYRYTDLLQLLAVSIAAAVVFSLTSHDRREPEAVKNCLLFPQFTQAAAADRDSITDGEEFVYSFRIVELFEEFFA